MKIGIDGRLWRETGVGRYIRALVRELGEIDKKNSYILWLRKKDFDIVKPPNSNWKIREADISWHTVSEQMFMPGIYNNENVDLIHIPYFSVPLYTPKPFIVTIHDLTISDFATGKATTKPMPIYAIKRIGYNFVLNSAIKKAEKIITVSGTVKDQIIERYKIKPEKVIVTYESGELEKEDEILSTSLRTGLQNDPSSLKLRRAKQIEDDNRRKFSIKSTYAGFFSNNKKPFILYVGNAHPHKNLEKLIKAFQLMRLKIPEMHLVLVGKDDYFYQRLKEWVDMGNMGDKVVFVNEINNTELINFYQNASLLVFPSLSEGFGIPGLEAMSLGCPVAASDIQVFREIYGKAAFYINQNDEKEMASKLLELIRILTNKKTKEKIIAKGVKQAQEYSWKKMAHETLVIYKGLLDRI